MNALVELVRRIGDAFGQRPHEVVPMLVLFLPLIGFAVLALFGDAIKKEGKADEAGLIACGTVLVAFGLAVWSVLSLHGLTALADQGGLRFARPALGVAWELDPSQKVPLDWISVGSLEIPFSLLLDPLSALMILVVTGVGSVIHIYSLGYMHEDEDRVRYFSYLNLFTFFMLLLVLAGSLPLMFVGWEGVGLCSYLLIGFWFRKKSASDAGMKAFIVNRIGDVGLILGMILSFHAFGTLDLTGLVDLLGSKPPEAMGEFGVITVVALLLFVGACGKSAQIPLHVWLPDAMEGPTPVSALIHAATMVTAGVYMVARLAPLYTHSATAMEVVAVVGAVTALMAATVALVQTDIKRVLAYSTVSQLGYMFLACGVGAFGVGVFHLYTHAFFKALLFLGSGSVIHALSGEQDMRKMGGLWRKVPWTFATFLVATLAISGIPPFAGFYSKDAILEAALADGKPILYGIGLFTALLTSFYMFRLLFLTFFGAFRGGHEAEHHLHESPWSMLGPLVILALGSLAGGLLPIPEWIGPAFRVPFREEHGSAWLSIVAVLVATAGIATAYYAYLVYTELPSRMAARFAPLRRIFEAKYGFDLAYGWFASRVVVGGSESFLWKRVDAGLIDGAVNGAGSLVGSVAQTSRFAQSGVVRGYVLLILGGAVALLAYLLWIPR
jgi:NADH-quinone oxidoreductase subunit L